MKWPLELVHNKRYYQIVNTALKKLNKPNLVNKVKIYRSSDRTWLHNSCIIALVPHVLGDKIQNKIVLFKEFSSIKSDKIRADVLRHETTHIVDLHNRSNELHPYSNFHDDQWCKLMRKIKCDLYHVPVEHLKRPWSYQPKKPYKYYDCLSVEK